MSVPEPLLLLPILAPLVAAALLGGRARRLGAGLLAVAPLTGLLALAPGAQALELPWLLLGTRLAPDTLARALLALTAPVAAAACLAAAGGYAGPRRSGLLAALAATVAALMGLLLAADLAALYFAQRIAYVPLSLFGVSVAASSLPEMSRKAERRDAVRRRVVNGFFQILFGNETLPNEKLPKHYGHIVSPES